jgi:heptosyltransferase II
MSDLLIIKTGALGDVLRTTAILPGLHARHGACRVTWVTAPGAVDLVRHHPLVTQVEAFDAGSPVELESLASRLQRVTWERVISLDDEESCCRLAARVGAGRICGAWYDDAARARVYTPDSAPWFDMGLLSTFGKREADRLKIVNVKSQPRIYAEMLGISMGKPQLPLPPASERFAAEFARRAGLHDRGVVLGLNTGAGGRWTSKMLPIERVVALCEELHARLDGRANFLLLGGRDEAPRNAKLAALLGPVVNLVDAGTGNSLLDFAALVSHCDLLVTSDSLALHVAVARGVRCVAFFAPTSAAEIELYGAGEKVVSTSADACSYRPDADTSTLTVERLAGAVMGQLALREAS